MKHSITILSLLISAPAFGADGDITDVTVFSDRAEVTRTARAQCDGTGRGEVQFPPLPVSIDMRTLRAEAAGRARAVGVSSRRTSVVAEQDDARSKLEKQIEDIDAKLKVLNDAQVESDERSRTAQGFTSYYKNVVGEAIRDPRAKSSEWKAAVDFLVAQIEEERLKTVERGVQTRALNRERQSLANDLARLGAAGSAREVIDARVAVQCGGENAPSVRLSYVVPGATWRPEYDLRFDAKARDGIGAGTVSLTVGAIVTQSTGEDWTDAKIAMSTSKPRLGSSAPLPAALYIDGNKAGDEKVLVSGQEERKNLSGAKDADAAGPQSVELEDFGQTFTLSFPHAATVKADGRPYWMPVDRVRGKGDATLVAVPKLSRYVYLALAFDNPAKFPLLEGTVHLYRGGSWVGDATMTYRAPREPIELSLGVDESYLVDRFDLREADETSSFLGGTRRYERRYRTTIENRSASKVRVEIREHIPVSKDEDIEVTLDDETTKGRKFDKDRGFVTFQLDVPARKSASTDLAYTIALPKDWKVD